MPWVFVAAHGLSLVAASRGYYPLQSTGFSLWWFLLLGSTDCRCEGSVVVAHGLSCSAAHGIFPYQGLNLCPLHWQAGYYPLWRSFIRALISFRRALPSWLKHLPNTLHPMLSHLGLRIQHVNLGKTQTCRPQESTKVESKDVCWCSEEIPPCLSQSFHFLWGEGRNALSHPGDNIPMVFPGKVAPRIWAGTVYEVVRCRSEQRRYPEKQRILTFIFIFSKHHLHLSGLHWPLPGASRTGKWFLSPTVL